MKETKDEKDEFKDETRRQIHKTWICQHNVFFYINLLNILMTL